MDFLGVTHLFAILKPRSLSNREMENKKRETEKALRIVKRNLQAEIK